MLFRSSAESCDASSIIPSSNNIFTSNALMSNSLSCNTVQGLLTIYVDDSLMTDTTGLESLYNISRSLIRLGMDSGELALTLNGAVVVLRYVDESEKDILQLVKVIASSGPKNNIIQWSLVGLGILAALIAVLAVSRILKKRRKKEISILDDAKSVNKIGRAHV